MTELWTFLQRLGQNLSGLFSFDEHKGQTKVLFHFIEFPTKEGQKLVRQLTQNFLQERGWKVRRVQLSKPHLIFVVSRA